MKKSILSVLFAGLLLLSVTACNTPNNPVIEGSDTSYNPFPTVAEETNQNGEPVTVPEAVTQAPDISAKYLVFTNVAKKVVVITAVATVRNDTVVADNTSVGWPKEGTELNVTGESDNWYRLTYGGETAYITKSVVCDATIFDGFTEVNETIEIAKNVNVRCAPTVNEKDLRGLLTKGSKVVRVGIGTNWSIILYDIVSETETDASGNKVVTTMRYYISNDCIVDPNAATEAATNAQ